MAAPHPTWAGVGRTVRVVRMHPALYHFTCTIARVAEHTRTEIVLDTGERFVRHGAGTYPHYEKIQSAPPEAYTVFLEEIEGSMPCPDTEVFGPITTTHTGDGSHPLRITVERSDGPLVIDLTTKELQCLVRSLHHQVAML